MYTSFALEQSVAQKGNQLLLTIARTFHEPEDCVVLGALAHLSPNGQRVTRKALAEHLSLKEAYIGDILDPFVHKYKFLDRSEHDAKVFDVTYSDVNGKPIPKPEGKAEMIDIFNYENHLEIDGTTYTVEELTKMDESWLAKHLPNTKLHQTGPKDIKARAVATAPKSLQTNKFNRPEVPCDQYSYIRNEKVHMIVYVRHRSREVRYAYKINCEHIVYRVKYNMLKLQLHYDRYSDDNFYHCSNPTCKHHVEFISATDVISRYTGSHSLQMLNQQRVPPQFSQPNTFNPMVRLPGGVSIHNNNSNITTPTNPNLVSNNNNAVKRPAPSHLCPVCSSPLHKGGNEQIQQDKRNLLAQSSYINTLTHDLFLLLKQLREYRDTQYHQQLANQGLVDASGNSGGPKQGVGARGGCSSAADLAARVEKLKDPLPWDEISSTDTTRLKQEQEKQKIMKEQLAQQAEMLRQQQERELQSKALEEEHRKKKAANFLKKEIFGDDGMTDDLKTDKKGNTLTEKAEKQKQSSSVLEQYASSNSSSNGPESTNSFFVMVRGQRYQLELVNEVLLDQMTEEEFDEYYRLMENPP